MTGDELPGPGPYGPGKAHADVPDIAGTEDGEDRTVSTRVVREDVVVLDTPDSAGEQPPADPSGTEDPSATAATDASRASVARPRDDAAPDVDDQPVAADPPAAEDAPAEDVSSEQDGQSVADEQVAPAEDEQETAPQDGAWTVGALPPLGAAYGGASSTHVVQDASDEMSPSELRVDFGAHLEANYQRLVAQMYAITLSPDQAHSAVQDAYSRAWRNWSVIGRSADPTSWVRRVAVRTTMRSWRHFLARLGFARATPAVAPGLDERTTALLTALRELPAPERRSVVLFHMAGLSPGEIAAVEQVSPSTISTRLDRARRGVMGDTSDLLTGVIELPGVILDDDRGYLDEMSMPPEVRDEPAGQLDDRWERAGTWNGGPDGSWIVAEAPPWDAPNYDEWPRRGAAVPGASAGGGTGAGPQADTENGTQNDTEAGREGEPVDGTGDTPRIDSEDKR